MASLPPRKPQSTQKPPKLPASASRGTPPRRPTSIPSPAARRKPKPSSRRPAAAGAPRDKRKFKDRLKAFKVANPTADADSSTAERKVKLREDRTRGAVPFPAAVRGGEGSLCSVHGCSRPAVPGQGSSEDPFCTLHAPKVVSLCAGCRQAVTGHDFHNALGGVYHTACMKCSRCGKATVKQHTGFGGQMFCGDECMQFTQAEPHTMQIWDRLAADQKDDQSKIVVAIDFGTANSGWALASLAQREDILMDTRQEQTRTSLLLNENLDVVAFGTEARKQFQILDEDVQASYLFFDQFKMSLHQEERTDRVLIKASNGRSLPAEDVFAAALQVMKDQVLERCKAGVIELNYDLQPSDLHWVLTVPAIWTGSAKQLMRNAITKCGVSKLDVALEPESAALQCMHGEVAAGTEMKRGTKYLVLDCGGGTVDIAVHEILDMEPLAVREIDQPHGGAWGSTFIDKQFLAFLDALFGPNFSQTLQRQDPVTFTQLMDNFEVAKHKFDGRATRNCRLPPAFKQFVETFADSKISDIIKAHTAHDDIKYGRAAGLKIGKSTMLGFFNHVITPMLEETKCLVQKHNVDFVFLVGGLGSSPVVQQRVRDAFHQSAATPHCRVICPNRPDLAVVSGAVRFGIDSTTIAARSMPCFYYVDAYVPFDSSMHRPDQSEDFLQGGHTVNCCRILDKLVSKGQIVSPRDIVTKYLSPAGDGFNFMTLRIWTSDTHAMYPSDHGVKECAFLRVDMPDLSGDIDRDVEVHVVFGGTQIKVYATDMTTGREFKCSIDWNRGH